MYSGFTDIELMRLLKSNDEKAFNEIYSRFQGLLFVYAARITRNDHEAADMVQEVFMQLWDKRAALEISTSLKGWLYTAIRYKFFDRLDKKKVRTDYLQSLQQFMQEGQYNTDEYLRHRELETLIEQGITALPSKMQEIFSLSRKDELSHREIAIRLQVSEKTVKNQVHNALRILRSKLGLFGFLLFFLR
ncbi:RNA polymerase sigma factor [Pseudoflavitalea rhizosphaerae]|uniref:RNA polymerase sigma factor n=1 Tax=Pseudoflavitalea rhizosphaerae TaxID=1884793 RepID=UPI000F8C845A|nr:RNA polymerase sigma-70 factor [Pseudoflavitalea rhizosphaerae]